METFYQVGILSLLAFDFLVIVLPNLLYLKQAAPHRTIGSYPKISILIPARNEEKNIGALLNSISGETYPNFEVLVLDDSSTDATAKIIQSFVSKDKRVRCLRGTPLPDGWAGKNYACHQLAQAASGEWLLFTDADTAFEPGLLEFSLQQALAQKADLVTGFPRFWAPSFWGRLISPNVYFIFLGFLPFYLTSRLKNPILSMGLGSYLFFKKEAYRKIGGHESVREILNEDMALPKKIKTAGLKLFITDPSRFIRCKMYENFNGIWEGYSKSLYKALGSSHLILTGFELLYLATLLMPFYFFIHYSLITPSGSLLVIVLTQIFLILLCRTFIALRYRTSWESVILHPLSIGIMLLVGIRSGILALKKGGYEWKGRKIS